MPFDVISSGAMLERNLPAVWEWFDYRRGVLASLEPNPAHHEIARWQDRFPDFTLVTQNVDGLHQKAGSRNVVELHGNVWRARCTVCRMGHDMSQSARPDACPSCGNSLRPDVVLFGEMLPPGVFEFAASKAAECDLCFVIGTSAIVSRGGTAGDCERRGRFVCEVNPERTPLSSLCDEVITGKAGEVVPQIGL